MSLKNILLQTTSESKRIVESYQGILESSFTDEILGILQLVMLFVGTLIAILVWRSWSLLKEFDTGRIIDTYNIHEIGTGITTRVNISKNEDMVEDDLERISELSELKMPVKTIREKYEKGELYFYNGRTIWYGYRSVFFSDVYKKVLIITTVSLENELYYKTDPVGSRSIRSLMEIHKFRNIYVHPNSSKHEIEGIENKTKTVWSLGLIPTNKLEDKIKVSNISTNTDTSITAKIEKQFTVKIEASSKVIGGIVDKITTLSHLLKDIKHYKNETEYLEKELDKANIKMISLNVKIQKYKKALAQKPLIGREDKIIPQKFTSKLMGYMLMLFVGPIVWLVWEGLEQVNHITPFLPIIVIAGIVGIIIYNQEKMQKKELEVDEENE